MSQCISQLGSQDSCGRMVYDNLVDFATPGTLSCTCQPSCAQSPCKAAFSLPIQGTPPQLQALQPEQGTPMFPAAARKGLLDGTCITPDCPAPGDAVWDGMQRTPEDQGIPPLQMPGVKQGLRPLSIKEEGKKKKAVPAESPTGKVKSPAGEIAALSDNCCAAMGTPIVQWEDVGGALSIWLTGHSVFATLNILLMSGAMDNQWAMRRLNNYLLKLDADGMMSSVERAACENLMEVLAARGAWAGPALEGDGDIPEPAAFSAAPSSYYRECQGDTISAGCSLGDAPLVSEMGRLSVGPGSMAVLLPDTGTGQAMPEAAPCTPSAEVEGDDTWNADVSSCPAPSPGGDGVGALLQAAQEAREESPKKVASASRKPAQARRKRKPTKRAAPDDGDSDAEAGASEPEGAKKPAKKSRKVGQKKRMPAVDQLRLNLRQALARLPGNIREHQIPRPKCLLLNKRSKEWLHTFCCKVLGLEEEDFSCEANMVPAALSKWLPTLGPVTIEQAAEWLRRKKPGSHYIMAEGTDLTRALVRAGKTWPPLSMTEINNYLGPGADDEEED